MLPRLWIAYDFVSINECLMTLDTEGYRKPFSVSLLTGVSVPQ
jgi:hypothetical protein